MSTLPTAQSLGTLRRYHLSGNARLEPWGQEELGHEPSHSYLSLEEGRERTSEEWGGKDLI